MSIAIYNLFQQNLQKVTDKLFNIRLIPEFYGEKTGQPVVKWIKNMEFF